MGNDNHVGNMAGRLESCINRATVLITNKGEPSETTCICCAELELELERTRIELRSTQKIVELLREEIYSIELEVMNSTIGGSVSPHERYKLIQEQRIRQSETTEEEKVKCNDNIVIYSRME
jgi:hypothetical protein